MIVCHCHGVPEQAVRRAVRQGARSLAEVAAACGAGTGCGGCSTQVAQILRVEAGPSPARQTGAKCAGLAPVA